MSQDPTTNATKKIHLVIAQAGLASRRKAEQWVAEGRVHVNGAPASIGLRVTPSDTITVDGKPLPQATTHQTFLLYKPVGVVSTTNDEHGRTSVTQLLAQLEPSTAQKRFFPIGRLDMDAEGLIILTTDGAFAHQVSHPKFETKKRITFALIAPPLTRRLRTLQGE
jgi:23S rRNA pseudouridine2605 synthase